MTSFIRSTNWLENGAAPRNEAGKQAESRQALSVFPIPSCEPPCQRNGSEVVKWYGALGSKYEPKARILDRLGSPRNQTGKNAFGLSVMSSRSMALKKTPDNWSVMLLVPRPATHEKPHNFRSDRRCSMPEPELSVEKNASSRSCQQ